MSEPITIEAEATQDKEEHSQALVRRETGGAVGYALSVDELHRNLEFVKEVMRKEMREGQDYGTIPGTGTKPTLLQPGAQKLLLTFNLVEKVKREVLRDFPNFHREYEFTISVCAQNGKEWDGVGTCSTLEAKYRYRKQERRCPKCGKHTIIAGKEEYGGGWLCWKKKGGCGATFQFNDAAIASQPAGRVEYDNPPDYWNTVRKMAFKRALVHASINATNTSDLWTQDLEESPGDNGDEPPPPSPPPGNAPGQKKGCKDTPPPVQSDSTPIATPKHLARLVEALSSKRDLVERYFRAIDWLLPTESLEKLEFRYVPASKEQFDALTERLNACENGEPATPPYPVEIPMQEKPKEKPIEVPRDANCDPNSPSAPWRSFPVPFGKHAGVKLGELDKAVLFGFWANYEVETEYNGRPKKPESIAKDQKFRDMLDEAGTHYEFKKPEDKQ